MRIKIIILTIFLSIWSCQKFTTVEVEKHTICKIKKSKMWNPVIQRFELKQFAILDDSSEVRITDRHRLGDTIRYIYIK
jgi:hypothetical protein